MRSIIFFTILFSLSISAAFAQKRKTPVKTVKTAPVQTKTVPEPAEILTEIGETEWKTLAETLEAEDWNKSAALAAQYLERLKTENEKKQIAQLRYIYLYALAGKIHASNARNNALAAENAWTELDRVMETFIGKEFLLPPRPFAEDCQKRLNYTCPVKDNPKAFRTTATNREGNAIHSFDYVAFETPVEIQQFQDKEAFLGGTLQKAEYNEDKAKPWIVRLFFNKGFIRVVLK